MKNPPLFELTAVGIRGIVINRYFNYFQPKHTQKELLMSRLAFFFYPDHPQIRHREEKEQRQHDEFASVLVLYIAIVKPA